MEFNVEETSWKVYAVLFVSILVIIASAAYIAVHNHDKKQTELVSQTIILNGAQDSAKIALEKVNAMQVELSALAQKADELAKTTPVAAVQQQSNPIYVPTAYCVVTKENDLTVLKCRDQ